MKNGQVESTKTPIEKISFEVLNRLQEKGLSQKEAADQAFEIQKKIGMRRGQSRVTQSFISRIIGGVFQSQKRGNATASKDTRYRALARLLELDEEDFIARVELIQG